MFCPNCGKKIPPHSKFCPNCGHDLTQLYNQDNQGSGQSRVEPEPPVNDQRRNDFHRGPVQPKPHHNKALCVVLILIIILGAGVAYHHHEVSQTPAATQNAQNNQNRQSDSNANNSNQSASGQQPGTLTKQEEKNEDIKTNVRNVISELWSVTQGRVAIGGGYLEKQTYPIYKSFQGGKSNPDYKSIMKFSGDLGNTQNEFYNGGVDMTPHFKSIHHDGGPVHVTYQVDYFFPKNSGTQKGLREGFIWHATMTKNGKKIITNKADNRHPVYKHRS